MAPKNDPVWDLVEEATLDFALGETDSALAKLEKAVEADPACFEAYHARAEVHFSRGEYQEALDAARRALAIRPDDIHIHTSLSRIWMEKGDKAQAEHHGAQARLLGWKQTLNEGSEEGPQNSRL